MSVTWCEIYAFQIIMGLQGEQLHMNNILLWSVDARSIVSLGVSAVELYQSGFG